MKILAPITITPAMLLASDLPETEYPAWSNVTTYAASTPSSLVRVIKGNKVWESAQGANTNKDPETAGAAWWIKVGPTNRWAMFDEVPSTVSYLAASSLSVTLAPGVWVTDLALVEFAGTSARVQVFEPDGTTLLFDQEKALPGIASASYFDWFFRDDVVTDGSIVFNNLPRRLNGRIVVTLQGPGAVSLGVLALGIAHSLGTLLADADTDIKDYSRVETDEFGAVTVTRRKRSKVQRYSLLVRNADVPRVLALRRKLSTVMCVFYEEGASDAMHDALLAYGLFSKFPLAIKGPVFSTYTLDVQGA